MRCNKILSNVMNNNILREIITDYTPKYMRGNVLHIIYILQSCSVYVYARYGCCDSRCAAGDKAVGGRKEPLLRYDGGPANMPIGQEVKADLPGPLPQLSVLPSYDAVQLIGPGATS